MSDDHAATDTTTTHWWFYFVPDDPAEVPKRFFVVAVTAVAVFPRMPLDAPWSIGGTLSHSFRKLVLLITVLYWIRHGLLGDTTTFLQSPGISLTLLATEGVLLSFLSLLTPYLLRKWMAERVNIAGGRRNPGKALMPWVWLFAGLTAVGVVCRVATGDIRTWVFKKMADALSFFPVMNTLRMYNSVTHSQTIYSGRGSVLTQVVVVAEYLSVLVHGSDVLLKSLDWMGVIPREFAKSPFVEDGVHSTMYYASFFRVLCHSILLNILDETYIIAISSATSAPTSSSSTRTSSTEDNKSRHNDTTRVPFADTVEDDDYDADGKNKEMVVLRM